MTIYVNIILKIRQTITKLELYLQECRDHADNSYFPNISWSENESEAYSPRTFISPTVSPRSFTSAAPLQISPYLTESSSPTSITSSTVSKLATITQSCLSCFMPCYLTQRSWFRRASYFAFFSSRWSPQNNMERKSKVIHFILVFFTIAIAIELIVRFNLASFFII